MSEIDLNSMTIDQLMKLMSDAEEAIATYEQRQAIAARAEMEPIAQRYGLTLEAIVNATAGSKRRSKSKASVTKKRPVPVYRDQVDISRTWSGRGRKPQWFIDATERGISEDDLRIK